MDFSISPKMAEILGKIRQFVASEIQPLEPQMQTKTFRELLPAINEKREKVRQMGLWAPQIPAQHRGVGLGFMEHALVSQELGRSPLGHFTFNCQAPDAGNMEILIEFGTDAQKKKFLD